MYMNTKKMMYQEKQARLFILISSGASTREDGTVNIDLSSYANLPSKEKNEKFSLEKSCDQRATLYCTLRMRRIGETIEADEDSRVTNESDILEQRSRRAWEQPKGVESNQTKRDESGTPGEVKTMKFDLRQHIYVPSFQHKRHKSPIKISEERRFDDDLKGVSLSSFNERWEDERPRTNRSPIETKENQSSIDIMPGKEGVLRQPSVEAKWKTCLLYTSPSPRDRQKSRMPSSA
eukprot:TRINITY_DN25012_c0_g1_i1.p1 TRINITY_DN25012_c0_g1~~TRINITY_DN25012_c0_g1_i1.p1  ORF type:complete len:235 (-),score=49.32 TRINITY_DN25012_c0_g1_i1:10-714(-)